MKNYSIATIHGDGIGKEVIPAGKQVLEAVAGVTGRRFDVRIVETPSRAARAAGLPAEITAFGDAVFAAGGAMFCGPVGGRFVYDLRARFADNRKLR